MPQIKYRKNHSPSSLKSLFVIDDDPDILFLLKTYFEEHSYPVQTFENPLIAYEKLLKTPPALVICDLKMPHLNGIELTQKIHEHHPKLPVILITADTTTQTAITALEKGIFDYTVKPINLTELGVLVERALKLKELERISQGLQQELKQEWSKKSILTKNPKMKQILTLIERVAPTDTTVLITGESGSGKEVIAKALHSESKRSKKPFLALNCSAIPEHLLESELFGHKKGAFTGAIENRKGLIEESHTGTLFLDEIGEMPLALQSKLLRVIQERKIKPVGDNKYKEFDTRIISATNKTLLKEIKAGRFREDLYYRLCVVPIEIPPLRERREDIPLLAQYFLEKFCLINKMDLKKFSHEALSKLLRMRWSGNVRQLENAIERAVILSPTSTIEEEHIQTQESHDQGQKIASLFSGLIPLKQIENEYISYVLGETSNNRNRAAEILGIDRKTLYRKLSQKVKSRRA